MKIDSQALRAKSPEPPMPFMMLEPRIWVRIDVAIDVGLDQPVHGDDAEAADHFRMDC